MIVTVQKERAVVKKVSLETFRNKCEKCPELLSYVLYRDSANVECNGCNK